MLLGDDNEEVLSTFYKAIKMGPTPRLRWAGFLLRSDKQRPMRRLSRFIARMRRQSKNRFRKRKIKRAAKFGRKPDCDLPSALGSLVR